MAVAASSVFTLSEATSSFFRFRPESFQWDVTNDRHLHVLQQQNLSHLSWTEAQGAF